MRDRDTFLVYYATGSRADYGIVRSYLAKLRDDPRTNLQILVTGALLDAVYGNQMDIIEEDGFKIAGKINVSINTCNVYETVHTMSCVMDKFGKFLYENRPDLMIILGDRYEMLPIAIASAMMNIPILHLHGGEATYANYDEFIRHSISKMSRFHFTSTEEYRKRVIQLGENPKTVYNLGALGAENCTIIDEKNVIKSVKDLPLKDYIVVLFHPETLLDVSPGKQIDTILEAIDTYRRDEKIVIIGSNADTRANEIRGIVKRYVEDNEYAVYFENLHSDAYHYLVKNSMCLIGNSSSGIIEAPSLGVYTINVGHRQDGRIKGNSVIDVECKKEDIINALTKVRNMDKSIYVDNPYYKENTSCMYYEHTMKILDNLDSDLRMQPKVFYDIDFSEGGNNR